jgi:SAM-dependent methyltransferase
VDLRPRSFSNVDGTGDEAGAAAYLDRVADQLSDLRSSWRAHLGLEPGERVLDAGCGLGENTIVLAQFVGPSGSAVGVDLSSHLIERARQRAAPSLHAGYKVADLAKLPFEAETFDAVYCERVFQHLQDPDAVMAELCRMLRPAGRLVVVDIDHSRTARDADDAELADLFDELALITVANPRSGRELRSRMVRAGFEDVAVDATLEVITDADRWRAMTQQSLSEQLEKLVEAGAIARERADAYIEDQTRRQMEGRFLASASLYCVSGTKPADPGRHPTADEHEVEELSG